MSSWGERTGQAGGGQTEDTDMGKDQEYFEHTVAAHRPDHHEMIDELEAAWDEITRAARRAGRCVTLIPGYAARRLHRIEHSTRDGAAAYALLVHRDVYWHVTGRAPDARTDLRKWGRTETEGEVRVDELESARAEIRRLEGELARAADSARRERDRVVAVVRAFASSGAYGPGGSEAARGILSQILGDGTAVR